MEVTPVTTQVRTPVSTIQPEFLPQISPGQVSAISEENASLIARANKNPVEHPEIVEDSQDSSPEQRLDKTQASKSEVSRSVKNPDSTAYKLHVGEIQSVEENQKVVECQYRGYVQNRQSSNNTRPIRGNFFGSYNRNQYQRDFRVLVKTPVIRHFSWRIECDTPVKIQLRVRSRDVLKDPDIVKNPVKRPEEVTPRTGPDISECSFENQLQHDPKCLNVQLKVDLEPIQ
uniref:Uncharacterized protein n=1 Tax=Ditylenchus dipsaci TaxID=166011 RepID=A0A915DMX7_9BILA